MKISTRNRKFFLNYYLKIIYVAVNYIYGQKINFNPKNSYNLYKIPFKYVCFNRKFQNESSQLPGFVVNLLYDEQIDDFCS